MKVHIQTVHARQRSSSAASSTSLRARRSKAGRPPMCYSFGTKANLEEHVRTQHLNLQELAGQIRRADHRTTRRLQSPALKKTDDAHASLLTGYGYEKDRPIACLEPSCPHRFMRNVDLENIWTRSISGTSMILKKLWREREAHEAASSGSAVAKILRLRRTASFAASW